MVSLHSWLETRFPRYSVEGAPIHGTYGLVFVMHAEDARTSPRRFALKTVDPARLSKRSPEFVRALFERELQLWLRIPSHQNVLPALGLEFASPPPDIAALWPLLPLVRMPYCDGSIREWTERPELVPVEDRLLALAQTCNGLMWLYEYGIEGHGDLKPDNLLRRNLADSFELPRAAHHFPNVLHPWNVRVADLGWANAWLGANQQPVRGWRPYSAPERTDGTFIPQSSDIFALGVIGVELLQGLHPAGRPTGQVAKWSDTEWTRWAASGPRSVNRVPFSALRDMLDACLTPDPSRRPLCHDLLDVTARTLEEHGVGCDALGVWTDQARNLPGNRESSVSAWSSRQVGALSAEKLWEQIRHLEARLVACDQTTETGLFDWLETAEALTSLRLKAGDAAALGLAGTLASEILEVVVARFDSVDLRGLKGWRVASGPADLAGFDAWEPLWPYGLFAVTVLRRCGQVEAATAWSKRLEDKRLAREEPLDDFIRRLLGA